MRDLNLLNVTRYGSDTYEEDKEEGGERSDGDQDSGTAGDCSLRGGARVLLDLLPQEVLLLPGLLVPPPDSRAPVPSPSPSRAGGCCGGGGGGGQNLTRTSSPHRAATRTAPSPRPLPRPGLRGGPGYSDLAPYSMLLPGTRTQVHADDELVQHGHVQHGVLVAVQRGLRLARHQRVPEAHQRVTAARHQQLLHAVQHETADTLRTGTGSASSGQKKKVLLFSASGGRSSARLGCRKARVVTLPASSPRKRRDGASPSAGARIRCRPSGLRAALRWVPSPCEDTSSSSSSCWSSTWSARLATSLRLLDADDMVVVYLSLFLLFFAGNARTSQVEKLRGADRRDSQDRRDYIHHRYRSNRTWRFHSAARLPAASSALRAARLKSAAFFSALPTSYTAVRSSLQDDQYTISL
ncbi:Nuclear receptor subfamily 2 group C member 2 [Frankliniella fusca]|uniref:Nuclear receptor subfamily 2 group C member 2 n=1 Tax=Frankliniella fusca TaxID=407009 RepID=A0AAE1GYI4_9NEOP|nr:Nuclear receptor subfamily 2 group C member 2 [Frankliniella fusca]